MMPEKREPIALLTRKNNPKLRRINGRIYLTPSFPLPFLIIPSAIEPNMHNVTIVRTINPRMKSMLIVIALIVIGEGIS